MEYIPYDMDPDRDRIVVTTDDIDHLKLVYERMVSVHGENPHTDYMIGFRRILCELDNAVT